MGARSLPAVVLLLFSVLTVFVLVDAGHAQKSTENFSPVIPRTWNDEAVASLEVPLAEAHASPVQIPADYYYRMPVRPVYKSYPVYAPGKEPSGYLEWLSQQEPEILFDPAKLKTEADWIKAGELVFAAPIAYDNDPVSVVRVKDVRNPSWYEKANVPLTEDGIMPFAGYVIRKKGVVEVGSLSCAMCHTRVMPDRTVIKGAQGNFPFDRTLAFVAPRFGTFEAGRPVLRLLFATPWLQPDPQAWPNTISLEEFKSNLEAIPPGVSARHGTSHYSPAQVPDLIGIKERRYLDRTGLVRHRDIGDLMRYAALNQDADVLARYGTFRPIEAVFGRLPDPAELSRYSDEQLYALALYLYSLKPPPNPNRRTPLAVQGEEVFRRERCSMCHTPPLYTSNKLTPAEGFRVPDDHRTRFDLLPVSVGTDSTLSLKTRRGTGYYKVPSLKGVWYRGPFEHNGSVAALDDWFDPGRLRDDYVPTGWKSPSVKTRAVKGHEFGLKLSAEDKRALIAFLRTL